MANPVTPQMILAERNLKRQLGVLAHTLNVEGKGMFWLGCDCYSCRDYYDPTGEQDARARNGHPEPAPAGGAGARGYLARADGVRPDELFEPRPQLQRADGVRPEDAPLARACWAAGLPLPPPPPVLERQNAVILGRAAEPVNDTRILEQMLARWRDAAALAQTRLMLLGQPANNDQAAQIQHMEARLDVLKAEQKVERLNQLILSMKPQI